MSESQENSFGSQEIPDEKPEATRPAPEVQDEIISNLEAEREECWKKIRENDLLIMELQHRADITYDEQERAAIPDQIVELHKKNQALRHNAYALYDYIKESKKRGD